MSTPSNIDPVTNQRTGYVYYNDLLCLYCHVPFEEGEQVMEMAATDFDSRCDPDDFVYMHQHCFNDYAAGKE